MQKEYFFKKLPLLRGCLDSVPSPCLQKECSQGFNKQPFFWKGKCIPFNITLIKVLHGEEGDPQKAINGFNF